MFDKQCALAGSFEYWGLECSIPSQLEYILAFKFPSMTAVSNIMGIAFTLFHTRGGRMRLRRDVSEFCKEKTCSICVSSVLSLTCVDVCCMHLWVQLHIHVHAWALEWKLHISVTCPHLSFIHFFYFLEEYLTESGVRDRKAVNPRDIPTCVQYSNYKKLQPWPACHVGAGDGTHTFMLSRESPRSLSLCDKHFTC